MTAQVLTLPVTYQRGVTRVERARERVYGARFWVMAKTVDKVPFVVMSRTALGRREVNAFNLGRDCSRYLGR